MQAMIMTLVQNTLRKNWRDSALCSCLLSTAYMLVILVINNVQQQKLTNTLHIININQIP